MTEAQFKPIVKHFLGQKGFEAIDIPKASNRTPDFEIVGDTEVHLLELKIKEDNPEEWEEDEKILAAGEILSKSQPVSHRNTLDGIIEDGCDQFAKHDVKNAKLHVLWLHCCGLDAELHFERFRKTLFGAQTMVSADLSDAVECYYFRDSSFFRYRDVLDAAIVSHNSYPPGNLELQFCVNSLSIKIARLRVTRLYECLNEGRCDPDEQERNGYAFIADALCPRSSVDDGLSYLRKKYELDHLQAMTFTQDTAAIAVQNKRG